MAEQHWLVKQEPEAYSWADLVKDKRTAWTGVRNFQARKHLCAMARGDRVLFYHSGSEKSVVGVAQVVREAYADPTAEEGDWSCVDLEAVEPLKRPVSLSEIRGALASIPLVRQSRLSVMPLTKREFEKILSLAEQT